MYYLHKAKTTIAVSVDINDALNVFVLTKNFSIRQNR